MAIAEVLKDETFTLPTPSAASAIKCANSLLQWIAADNGQRATPFANTLAVRLQGCFGAPTVHVRTARGNMWRKYHKLTSSDEFRDEWVTFLRGINLDASPIFYQFVSDKLMDYLVQYHYPLPDNEQEHHAHNLDYEEVNAIRYIAGYVIKNLLTKVGRSSCTNKEEIKLCLQELIEKTEDSCGNASILLYPMHVHLFY